MIRACIRKRRITPPVFCSAECKAAYEEKYPHGNPTKCIELTSKLEDGKRVEKRTLVSWRAYHTKRRMCLNCGEYVIVKGGLLAVDFSQLDPQSDEERRPQEEEQEGENVVKFAPRKKRSKDDHTKKE